MILLSSMRSKVLKKYRQRWSIEVSFKQLKSDGFDLEKTGIKDSERLKTLCSLLSLASISIFRFSFHRTHINDGKLDFWN
jgi:transposase